ncbi:hypothetical protein [uncultured Mitsuokella sp.]|uniref:hypothetical protein n=1 Tax=uncultured Mitsuokella sp. TaxID=453120 RepID=UPI0026DB0046|nr:hypothetical protein [uncultured Mitsuokella sp.]
MHNPRLLAVGSSKLVAREIAGITRALLGGSLPLQIKLTSEIKAPSPDTFYICAITQEPFLRCVLPEKQLCVFDLHPTTRFFLDIARIPAGETVYVFNNLYPYTQLLIRECRELGIDKLDFRPLAFEEMPKDALMEELEKARWLIGVEPFVGKDLLLASPFREHLREDLTIIPGHRTASVASASHLLTGLAEYFQEHLKKEYWQLSSATPLSDSQQQEGLLTLARQTTGAIRLLQMASLEAIKQQIGTTAASPEEAIPACDCSAAAADEIRQNIEEQFATLSYLTDRLRRLSVPQPD